MALKPVPRVIDNVCRLAYLNRFNGLHHSRTFQSAVFGVWRVLHVLDFRHLNIFIDSYRTYVLTSVVLISRNACQASLPAASSPCAAKLHRAAAPESLSPSAATHPGNSPQTP